MTHMDENAAMDWGAPKFIGDKTPGVNVDPIDVTAGLRALSALGWSPEAPRFAQATNRTNLRRTVEVGVWRIPLAVQQRAMGIDWTNLRELSEAIPPAYTQHVGRQLIDHLSEVAA